MLESVVGEGGTAPMAAIPGYRVGGKTGTAQAYNENCRCYSGVVASFIGMAPADDPALVVAVSIFNPRVGRYGGELGGPVFKRVMTYALQARQVPPTGTQAPNLALDVRRVVRDAVGDETRAATRCRLRRRWRLAALGLPVGDAALGVARDRGDPRLPRRAARRPLRGPARARHARCAIRRGRRARRCRGDPHRLRGRWRCAPDLPVPILVVERAAAMCSGGWPRSSTGTRRRPAADRRHGNQRQDDRRLDGRVRPSCRRPRRPA